MGLWPTNRDENQSTDGPDNPTRQRGDGCGRNRPLADAWGYLATPSDRMRNRFSTVQPPFEAALRATTETDLAGLQSRDLSHEQRGERWLQPRLAAKIGCPPT